MIPCSHENDAKAIKRKSPGLHLNIFNPLMAKYNVCRDFQDKKCICDL